MIRALVSTLVLMHSVYSFAVSPVVDEDEFLLPPLFHDFLWNNGTRMGAGGVNVVAKEGQKRSAHPGEWLDYGDRFQLLSNLSVTVLGREKLAYTAGGALSMVLESPSRVILERGWMRVWKKEDSFVPVFSIKTPQDEFQVKEGEFWINARNGVTDVYLLSGEVKAATAGRSYGPQTYFSFEGTGDGAKYGAKAWDPKAIDVRIAAAHPGLMKLVEKTGKEWKAGGLHETYAHFRKKGWRKGLRK